MFNPCYPEPPDFISAPSQTSVEVLSEIELSEEEIAAILRNLDPNKAGGRDGIPERLLKELANQSRSPSLRSSCRGTRGSGIIHNRKPEILTLIKLRMRYR